MKKIIAAFARNKVFANLVMITILMAGILSYGVMVREDMPDMELDMVKVTVSYPGADPEEVEEGISRKIEDAIDGLEGIDEYTSTSSEGSSVTTVTVLDGHNPDDLLDRIQNEIDGITTFPDDAETPSVVRPQKQDAVMTLALIGGTMEAGALKEWADQIKSELQAIPGVSQVEVSGTRAYEIGVELSQETLRKYGLTLSQVATIISENSMNLSGGTIKTDSEEIRLRSVGRKYTGRELSEIQIIAGSAGEEVSLGELARVKDGFTENELSVQVNGTPAVLINILAGDEDTITIADKVTAYQKEKNDPLRGGAEILILSDNTESIRSSLDTLMDNALLGLLMVSLLLWLFMDTRIAFWVGMGIPISLLGGLAIVNFVGLSINKITLFGLIMVLGIVADDAIVVGEAIFVHRQNGASPLKAVVNGVSEVGLSVLAAVLTTIVAFLPLYNINGMMGKFIIALPTAVIACLTISLLESLVMLPSHLSDLPGQGSGKKSRSNILSAIDRFHNRTVASMDWMAQNIYLPILTRCLVHRYIAVSSALCLLLICVGMVNGGVVKFDVFPKNSSSVVVATVEFPDGTPFDTTRRAVETMENAAREAAQTFATTKPLIENTLATIGQEADGKQGAVDNASPNIGGVRITLLNSEESGIHSDAFLRAWEQATGPIPGVESLDFSATMSGPPGSPIEVCFRGENMDELAAASERTSTALRAIDGISQVYSDNEPGKKELTFSLKEEARHLGITLTDLASQVHAGYYGKTAVTIQRGNDEVEVNVRLTEKERQTRGSLQGFMLSTDTGAWVPLSAVAKVTTAPGYASITRKDGSRQIKVSAKVDTTKLVPREAIALLNATTLPAIQRDYPGVRIVFEGDSKRSSDSFSSLTLWFPISVMGIFLILATIFRSYAQPFIVLCTIPFGLVGAILGHFLMGHMLSLLSVFGMVALTGVVVNDAIVLIERTNMNLQEGMGFDDALIQGGIRRFRAVMLTSISTVGGLLPLITETSQYAQQLIPMAISLAFGVGFATVLTLGLIPCLFTIANDLRCILARATGRPFSSREELEPATFRAYETQERLIESGVEI